MYRAPDNRNSTVIEFFPDSLGQDGGKCPLQYLLESVFGKVVEKKYFWISFVQLIFSFSRGY